MNNNQIQPTNQIKPNRFHLKTWQWVSVLAVLAVIAGGAFVVMNRERQVLPQDEKAQRIIEDNKVKDKTLAQNKCEGLTEEECGKNSDCSSHIIMADPTGPQYAGCLEKTPTQWAEEKGDYTFCDQEKEEQPKWWCHILVARKNKDLSICDKIKDEKRIQQCYQAVQKETGITENVSVTTDEFTILEKCIAEKSAYFEETKGTCIKEQGILTVFFKKNITESEIKNLLNSYNLRIWKIWSQQLPYGKALIQVSPGAEFEWACRIELHDIIQEVSISKICP